MMDPFLNGIGERRCVLSSQYAVATVSFSFICFFRYKAALKELAERPYNAVLSDIGLPDGSGWELLARAQLPATVYTGAMSGFALPSDRAASLSAGFREHQ